MSENYNLLDDEVKSRLLEQNYVYYNSLNVHKPSLYKAVEGKLSKDILSAVDKGLRNSDKIEAMARAELSKELEAVNNFFGGVKIKDTDLYDKQFYNELMNAINNFISMRNLYQRNILLVQDSQEDDRHKGGQKSLVTYFSTYLRQQLNEEFKKGVLSADKINILDDAAVGALLDREMPNIVHRALKRMFNERGLESGIKDVKTEERRKELEKAYQTLLDELTSYDNHIKDSPLTKEFYNIYKIDEIKDGIKERLTTFKDKNYKTLGRNVGTELKGRLETQLDSRGGVALEAVYSTLANIKIKNAKVIGGAIKSGQTGMKPDIIMTIGIDIKPVEDMLESLGESEDGKSEKSVRAKNVAALKKLQDRLDTINEKASGFVVYVNAKNQNYNKDHDSFSAGNKISARNLGKVMSFVSWTSNFDVVIGAILQLADRTVGSHILEKEDFQNLLARNVAYLLFDDVDQIGRINKSGVNALHLLNLNGIYIPISLVLFALADAIRDANTDKVENLVRVTITNPRILFPKITSEIKWLNGRPAIEAWREQRDDALDHTKIQAKFLRNFQEIIQTYIDSSGWRG